MDAEPSTSASVAFLEPHSVLDPTVTDTTTAGPLPQAKMTTDSGASFGRSRTLVLCFDGTANQYDGDNTNVVKFYSLLKKDNTDEQLCYYQPGIGTYLQPGVVQPLFQWGAKMLDEAVAWYLDAHVRGGYTFLMQNYRPGDKICIFGFSRGAYTARALAGMLHKIGLLPKDNPEQLPLAYKLFKNDDTNSRELAAGFKKTFCRSVLIEFVGVWDTVASVGVLRSKTLPFTTTNTTIKTFRHALALDEHRAKFRPNLYHRLTPDARFIVPDVTAVQEDIMVTSPASATSSFDEEDKQKRFEDELRAEVQAEKEAEARGEAQTETQEQPGPAAENPAPKNKKRLLSLKNFLRKKTKPGEKVIRHKRNVKKFDSINPLDDPADDRVGMTDVLEVWFAGCHCDVGGGAVPNGTTHCLSDIPLRWMVRQVVQAQCGITFDNDAFQAAGIPNSVFAGVGFPVTPPAKAKALPKNSPKNSQEKAAPALAVKTDGKDQKPLEAFGYGRASGESDVSRASKTSNATDATSLDAVMPIHDELVIDKWWWLLEMMPTSCCWQDGRGEWHYKWSIHRGRGREIPDFHPKFHESVKERMEDTTLKYVPRATWRQGSETYVS